MSNALNYNIFWTLFDRIGRILISFVTGIMVARMLAPEIYGVLSSANALVAVISFLNMAAIEAIVVRSLVREPEEKNAILGSAFTLRLLGAGASVLTVIAISTLMDQQPPITSIIAPIIASASLFNAMEIGEYWLRQIFSSKYGVIARQIALVIGAGGRIWAAGSESPLLLLAVTMLLEALLIAIGLALSLHRFGAAPWHWHMEWKRCRQLFTEAFPILIATAFIGIYARISFVMLGHWRDAHTVGLFGVATMLSEATYALPIAIMASVTPLLLARKRDAEELFLQLFKLWLRRVTWLGFVICLFLFYAIEHLIFLLFGSKYDGSVDIFQILIWSAFFVFVSIASEVWLVGNDLQRYQLPKATLAAVVSVLCNLALVPAFGAKGAAISTLLSYSVSAFWANALFHDTRPLFRLQCMVIFPFKWSYDKDTITKDQKHV